MNTFAVFGNPIEHSKSPQIQTIFSITTGIPHSYSRILAPKKQFEQTLQQFFLAGGLGANITTPFKERACDICDLLTERASIARAVNTIKKQPDGSLLGDNTDGLGLIGDLQRLNMLNQKNKVLLVGAGGAARGVILPLLTFGCQLTVTNRTFIRAKELVNSYNHIGEINAIPLDELTTTNYDLIINATTTSIQGQIPKLPTCIITPKVRCYDMFYQKSDTPFIIWCKQQGAENCADGLGMLIEQAAYSFLLWHGVFPPTQPVLKYLGYNNRIHNTK